jgi:putative ABC transport system permease protein
MAIPIKYNLRYLLQRWTGTLATAVTFGLVVGVFVMVMTLATGVRRALTTAGDPLNVLVMRKGVMAEGQSVVSLDQYHAIQDLPDIAKDAQGRPMVAPEVLTLVNKPRAADGRMSNLQLRGVASEAFQMRAMVKVTQGRLFRPGLREIVVSETIAKRFRGFALGQKVRLGRAEWSIVGLFQANESAFASEAWMDYHEMMNEFDRAEYNTAVLRVADAAAVAEIKRLVQENRRVQLVAKTEAEYYAEQTVSARPLQAFGFFLAVFMAIGACFAGMNTMYANVAGRQREIGTLRVLGFSPPAILASFLIESILLAAIGGAIGCLGAMGTTAFLGRNPIGTMNFQTFSEVVFFFRVTPALIAQGMAFALAMGALGGLPPALHAARRPILDAMRQA